ncbi:MAG: EAL domain-containing protein [Bryobacterales bacterium]
MVRRSSPPAALESARVGVWAWDLDRDVIRFSESWAAAVGDDAEDAVTDSESWFNRVHPNYVQEVRRAIDAHLAGETDSLECDYRFRARDGGYVWVLNRAVAERDEEGRAHCLIGCQIDISSIVDVEKRVLHDAYRDRLTGLPNRRAFLPVLERACEQARNGPDNFALLFLDLDKFKTVNDTMGHAVGDELLAAAAGRLEELKGSNGYVARLGGDEFVVLLHDVGSEENALAAARRIHESLCRPYDLSGREVQSGASIGIALGGSHEDVSAQDMMRDADQAMYQAKTGRKGVAVYCANMRNKASLTQNLQLELAGAAERAELELHFQPIVCLRRGVVTGAEALLRWKRPGGERMAAAEFIPLAEDAGLLSVIGEWSLRAACIYRRGWLKQGYGDFCVSVNVSASQLQREDFAERVMRILRRTELPAELLQIEINESVLSSPSSNTARNLQMLIDGGVRLAVDDFGAGDASVSRLTSVPLHAVKLHRHFLAGVEEDAAKQSIVRGMVSLAHAIKLRVGAEGIESAAMLRQVEAEHCDMAQGYYLSRPMPAADLSRILRATEAHAAANRAAAVSAAK